LNVWSAKGKRPEQKSQLNAGAFMVGCVRSIQSNLGSIMAAKLRLTFVKTRSAIKIRILFLSWDSPAKENRQSEKLNYQAGLVHSARTINFPPLYSLTFALA
jgi:hypothetical protein